MEAGRKPQRSLGQTHTILAIGDVAPGGAAVPCEGRPLAIAALRDLLERLVSIGEIVHLTPACLPSNPWKDRKVRQRISLAFIGGFAGHCDYVVDMLGARRIPAHFFVPLDRIGLPGRASLKQLHACGEEAHIRIEVDLSDDAPNSLWGRIDLLRRASATLALPRGVRPRYVWFGLQPLDVRVRLLLEQTGFTAALSRRRFPAEIRRTSPILEAWPIEAGAPTAAIEKVRGVGGVTALDGLAARP